MLIDEDNCLVPGMISANIDQFAYIKEVRHFFVAAELLKYKRSWLLAPRPPIIVVKGNTKSVGFAFEKLERGMSYEFSVAWFTELEVQKNPYKIRMTFRNKDAKDAIR